MVHKVPLLGLLMMIQGGLMVVFTLFCVFASVLGALVGEPGTLDDLWRWGSGGGTGDPPDLFLVIMYGQLAVQYGLMAALTFVAGFRVRQFKGRWLSVVALLAGGLTIWGAFCIPTAFALAIYGLIVHLGANVGDGFRMRAAGATVEQILARYPGPVPPPEPPAPQSARFS